MRHRRRGGGAGAMVGGVRGRVRHGRAAVLRRRARQARAPPRASRLRPRPADGSVIDLAWDYQRREKISRIVEHAFGMAPVASKTRPEPGAAPARGRSPDVADWLARSGSLERACPIAPLTPTERLQQERTVTPPRRCAPGGRSRRGARVPTGRPSWRPCAPAASNCGTGARGPSSSTERRRPPRDARDRSGGPPLRGKTDLGRDREGADRRLDIGGHGTWT